MIDKNSEEWKSAPIFVKTGLLCVFTRKTAIGFEIFSVILAILCLLAGFVFTPFFIGTAFFGSAYWYAASIRWVDNSGLWGTA